MSGMKPLEPLLPGETRSEYLDRLEAAEAVTEIDPSGYSRPEYDPAYPKRWGIWWQGSGPQRGTHVMEMARFDLSFSREIAYLGAGGENPQQEGLHDQAEAMVQEHNRIVDQLRERFHATLPVEN
jgi:hypothetical protein